MYQKRVKPSNLSCRHFWLSAQKHFIAMKWRWPPRLQAVGSLDLPSLVIVCSLYNMLSATAEMCNSMRRSCLITGGVSTIAEFNFISAAATIVAGALGVLSTVVRSGSFVLGVLFVAILTMIFDTAEIVNNARAPSPSSFVYVMAALHLCLNLFAAVVFYSYYTAIRSRLVFKYFRHTDDRSCRGEEGKSSPATSQHNPIPTETTPLAP